MYALAERYENEIINFDRDKEVERIGETMRNIMRSKLRRRGVVVAVSGGIDSSVSAALAVKAFGANKAFFIR
ncbi:MAG: hypothetical protein KZQ72_04310 [Candidatus Thiodiazotropha sp. (ex Cardiolucina cf. quadrata)]|nr:hypothetical protein [Candidatus Thiodiazotropha sp. (ex Cardiolucina cf. quadrata)]